MSEGRGGNNAILECINLWLGKEDRERQGERGRGRAGRGTDLRLDGRETGRRGGGEGLQREEGNEEAREFHALCSGRERDMRLDGRETEQEWKNGEQSVIQ